MCAVAVIQNTVEWLGHFVLWVILMVAAVLVIIWEYSFPPNTHPATPADFTVTHFVSLYRPTHVLSSFDCVLNEPR